MQRVLRYTGPAIALVAVAGVTPAAGQTGLFPEVSARLGGLALSGSTDVRVEGGGRPGDLVDFEDDFGIDNDVNVANLGLEWQPLQRHLFRFGWYRSSRDGGRTLEDTTITWGGVDYPVGAEISAELTNTVWEADWTWWLWKRERAAVGAELGTTVLDIDARVDGRARIGDEVRELHRRASGVAPVPTVGVAGRVAVGSRVYLEGQARLLPSVEFDTVEGDASMLVATVDWMALDRVGLGARYTRFAIDATITESNFTGDLDLTTDGFQLYARIDF